MFLALAITCLAAAVGGGSAVAAGSFVVVGSTPVAGTTGGMSTLAYPFGVTVAGRYAYAPDNDSIVAIDLLDPTAPVVVGRTPTAGVAGGLSAGASPTVMTSANGYVFANDDANHLIWVIDVSSPTSPVVVGRSPADGSPGGLPANAGPKSITARGSLIYVVNGNDDSLSVVDATIPASPVVVGTTPVAGSIGGFLANQGILSIALKDDYAYVTDTLRGLTVVDVSVPTAPVVVGVLPPQGTFGGLPGGARGQEVAIRGDYAYLTTRNVPTVAVVDLSTRSSPTVVGLLGSSGASGELLSGAELYGIGVSDHYLIATDGNNAVAYSIDVSAPTVPLVIATTPTPGTIGGFPDSTGFPSRIAFGGGYAVVAGYGNNRMSVLDISAFSPPSSASPAGTTPGASLLAGSSPAPASQASSRLADSGVPGASLVATAALLCVSGVVLAALRLGSRRSRRARATASGDASSH